MDNRASLEEVHRRSAQGSKRMNGKAGSERDNLSRRSNCHACQPQTFTPPTRPPSRLGDWKLVARAGAAQDPQEWKLRRGTLRGKVRKAACDSYYWGNDPAIFSLFAFSGARDGAGSVLPFDLSRCLLPHSSIVGPGSVFCKSGSVHVTVSRCPRAAFMHWHAQRRHIYKTGS